MDFNRFGVKKECGRKKITKSDCLFVVKCRKCHFGSKIAKMGTKMSTNFGTFSRSSCEKCKWNYCGNLLAKNAKKWTKKYMSILPQMNWHKIWNKTDN